MDENRKSQIQQRLEEQDTEALLEIWKQNDREAWSNEAFEVIREILLARIGEVPAQGLAESAPATTTEEEVEDTYYNFDHLLSIASWASALSWCFLLVGGLIILTPVVILIENFVSGSASFNLLEIIPSLLNTLLSALVSVFFFVMSRAIAEGLFLLMDIEDNTRRAIQKPQP